MSELPNSFSKEIESHQSAKAAPTSSAHLEGAHSSLSVRRRGCFVVEGRLNSPTLGRAVEVLYSEPDPSVPKLTASHVMSPVGPNEGIGGQHGFPRWADYKVIDQNDGPNGEKRIALQAMRPDNGIALSKAFELSDSTLSSQTTIYNPGNHPTRTSLGEHYYFSLVGEHSEGLRVDGRSIDKLLGSNAEASVMEGKSLFWKDFNGEAIIDFPEGHSIKLSAEFNGEAELGSGMLIWHRPGSPSICFEPTVGFDLDGSQNEGLILEPKTSATLSTSIQLL